MPTSCARARATTRGHRCRARRATWPSPGTGRPTSTPSTTSTSWCPATRSTSSRCRGSSSTTWSRSQAVSPTDVAVVAPTPGPTLTLTTCNPRYSASQRLVVHATLFADTLTGHAKTTGPSTDHVTTSGTGATPVPKHWWQAIAWAPGGRPHHRDLGSGPDASVADAAPRWWVSGWSCGWESCSCSSGPWPHSCRPATERRRARRLLSRRGHGRGGGGETRCPSRRCRPDDLVAGWTASPPGGGNRGLRSAPTSGRAVRPISRAAAQASA